MADTVDTSATNTTQVVPVGAAILTPENAAAAEVIQQQVTTADYMILRYAVVGLIVAIILALSLVGILSWHNKDMPEGVIAIGSAAVGALATMLVRPPSASRIP